MSNSVLELRLSGSMSVDPESFVVFTEVSLSATGISYNKSNGIITFKETGQYSIKWWVATETTLKGAIGFHLVSPQGIFLPTPGCSPIKTGQVTGFGAIDITTPETTLALQNKSSTNTVISRKAGTKAYMLITPIGPSSTRVYRGDISTAGRSIQVPLGNGLYYRLERLNTGITQLVFEPVNGTTLYDYRRLNSYEGTTFEGNSSDTATLSGVTIMDTPIYNNSREIHWVLVRVQNPISKLWSLYEVRFFISGAGARATVWVNVIEEEVSY